MKLNVIKNARRNIIFGFSNKLVNILCPFVTRTVIQIVLGAEYLGLNSLFTSVISILSLTELGFGTAVVYHMYRPVAENDTATVCALLKFYKRVYRGIGIMLLIIGIVLIPFLPHLISGTYPEGLNLVFLYLIYLFNTAISYFMYAYMSSLLVVYQREDINSSTNMMITLLLNGSQIVMLFAFRDYYLFTLMMPVFTVASNLRIAYMVKRMFPQYHCEGALPENLVSDIRLRVGGAFLSKVCVVSRNAFDSIFVSMFLGLIVTAMYNNYYYIMHAVCTMLSVVSVSFFGGVGNHVVTKSVEENFTELKMLNFIYMWISGWCTICLFCLFQPFMELWMGADMMFPVPVVVLFCIYFYLLSTGDMISIYSSVNGLWWYRRNASLMELTSNLVLNFILGKFFGIYGIIIATNITIFMCNFVWGIRITFKYYFQLSRLKEYYYYHIKYFMVTLFLCILTYGVCLLVPAHHTPGSFLLRIIICMSFPNAGYLLIYRNSEMYEKSVVFIRKILKRENG